MTLMIRIAVNNDPPLALVSAQRVSNVDAVEHDDLTSSYEVTVLERDAARPGGLKCTGVTTVDHRYGDGALALARAAMDAVCFEPVQA